MVFSFKKCPVRAVLAIAIVASPCPGLANGRGGVWVPPELTDLLASAAIRFVDASTGQGLERGRILRAAMVDRCTLELTIADMLPRVHRIALGDLRYVQGDDHAMVEISSRRDPARSVIFELPTVDDAHGEVMFQLAARARECGSELAGPPALISTPHR